MSFLKKAKQTFSDKIWEDSSSDLCGSSYAESSWTVSSTFWILTHLQDAESYLNPMDNVIFSLAGNLSAFRLQVPAHILWDGVLVSVQLSQPLQ